MAFSINVFLPAWRHSSYFVKKPGNDEAATYGHSNETESELAYNHDLMKT